MGSFSSGGAKPGQDSSSETGGVKPGSRKSKSCSADYRHIFCDIIWSFNHKEVPLKFSVEGHPILADDS